MHFSPSPVSIKVYFRFLLSKCLSRQSMYNSKENRISEKHVILRYGCTECQSAFSIYLVSNASKESLLSQDCRWNSFKVIGEDIEAQ